MIDLLSTKDNSFGLFYRAFGLILRFISHAFGRIVFCYYFRCSMIKSKHTKLAKKINLLQEG